MSEGQVQTHHIPQESYLENRKTSLAMGLAPLLASRIPELDRGQARPRHAEVRGVKHITRRAIHVDRAVTEAVRA